ncbi:YesL family protein [Roseburia hominis]
MMKKRLNIENPFFEFMGRLGDLALVNILFLICSLPVVTIGASLAAMYECFRRMREGEFVSAFRDFMGVFRESFKKATPIWLLMLATGAVLVFDLTFLGQAGTRGIWGIVGMVTGALMLLWEMVFAFLFPVVIWEEGSLKEKLVRSLYLAVRNLPYTLLMVAMNIILPVCIVLGDYFMGLVTPIYVVAGFGLIAFADVVLLERCKE